MFGLHPRGWARRRRRPDRDGTSLQTGWPRRDRVAQQPRLARRPRLSVPELRRRDVRRVRQPRRGCRAHRDLLPGRGRGGASGRSAANLLRGAGNQSAARRRVQGDGRVKVAVVAPLVSVIREPQRGGSQAFVCDLARGLVDRGHDVDLYAASGSVLPGVNVIDAGVDHRALEATLYRSSGTVARGLDVAVTAFARVYDAVRETGYDVVHNHAFDAPAVARATALQAPVLHTLHPPPDAEVADALRQAAASNPPPAVA